ncbi:MAG: autotransporter outer membrane beta-barrel domain-containing protein, partial [Planctomycetes bacterium]|nr:autotransporter outer membrane beta-barrel domain-containing protein [Planctomycetota bacterium]
MTDLEDAFDNNLVLGGRSAVSGLQQLYGAYAAYANQPLQVDSDRFRRLWQSRVRSFLDNRAFTDLLTEAAGVGLASASGLASVSGPASPVLSCRSTIPAGRGAVWASGFGSWADQKNRNSLAGYDYDSRGFALGYEYTRGDLLIGVAASYADGDLDVRDLRYKNDVDVLNLALYGVYAHRSGLYLQGGLGYGHAWNDYRVDLLAAPGASKKGKYGSDLFSAGVELGYAASLPGNISLVPSLGLEYTHVRNESWSERLSGTEAQTANRFDAGHDHGLSVPLGLRLGKLIRFGRDGGSIVPEIRAAVVYQANRTRPTIRSGFTATPADSATMIGVEPGRT